MLTGGVRVIFAIRDRHVKWSFMLYATSALKVDLCALNHEMRT